MAINIKDNGKIIKQMDMENLFISMDLFMRDNGKIIKLMDGEFLSIRMVLFIKVIGVMIYRTDLANLLGK